MGTVSDSVTTSWERAQQGENQDDEQDRVEHRRLSRLLSGLSILFRAASAFKMLTKNLEVLPWHQRPTHGGS
jgi:hypothetical protein